MSILIMVVKKKYNITLNNFKSQRSVVLGQSRNPGIAAGRKKQSGFRDNLIKQ